MKNLQFLNRGVVRPVSSHSPDLPVISACFDVITNNLTCVLGPDPLDLSVEVQQSQQNGTNKVLANIVLEQDDKIISFRHFEDLCHLIFVMQKGDIYKVDYSEAQDPYSVKIEIVGSVDVGLRAAVWSPDDETLSLVTGEKKVVLLSRDFQPFVDVELSANDANKTNQVNVGWGKRETQFKGRGAKKAERMIMESLRNSGLKGDEIRDPTLKDAEQGEKSKFDSGKCSITWRGDCEYFAVSTLETVDGSEIRLVRVFNREGVLESACERVDGLEEHIAWKPQGALIAATQRKVVGSKNDHTVKDILINPEFVDSKEAEEDLDLVFFEKNGLRHGEFALRVPLETTVKDLLWSMNSEVLAVVLEEKVQLWTMKNYHWYLKQEISASSMEPIISVNWHPEKALTFNIITASCIDIIDLAYGVISGPTIAPFDVAMMAVIDGTNCSITPFSVANVPPPMSFREVSVDANIVDIAISKDNLHFGIATQEGISFASLSNLKGRFSLAGKIDRSGLSLTSSHSIRQVCWKESEHLAVLVDNLVSGISSIIVVDAADVASPKVSLAVDVQKMLLMKSHNSYSSITCQSLAKEVFSLSGSSLEKIATLGQLCCDYHICNTRNGVVVFGLTAGGKLYANERLICSAVTSIKVTESYLLHTTAQHQLRFVHLDNDFSTYTVADDKLNMASVTSSKNHNNSNEHSIMFEDERIRSIEKGSIIVAVSPSKFSVVLQAPRGNLETIYPRIMVLNEIRKCIKEGRYKDAFAACRTHRIDLDMLCDYDEGFFNNIEHFIEEIDNEDYLNLFLSCLNEENVAVQKYKETRTDAGFTNPVIENKVNRVCEAVLECLLQPKYKSKYVRTIITAYASQTPPKLREALSLIGAFEDDDEKENAVKYLCFLRDVNVLYDTALGLYDIPLTLLVAQQSQKDPKEYLPFLQNLIDQEVLRREFQIDDFLGNYEMALAKLHQLGSEKELEGSQQKALEEEFDRYMISHGLYKKGLRIHHDGARRDSVLKHYADHLRTSNENTQAGLVYELLQQYEDAVDSYSLAQEWQKCLSIIDSHRESFGQRKFAICEDLVDRMTESHRYKEAGYIEITYLKRIEAGARLYCRDYRYDEAVLAISSNDKPELIEEIVKSSLDEGFGTIAELISDCKGQINSQVKRLRELRKKKQEDPYNFFGISEIPDEADDVSVVASETSTRESFFTRYTGKTRGTAQTGASRRTVKNRRREERKKARGKKGTIYEEEYLIESIGRLHERLVSTKAELIRLLEGLVRFNKFEQAVQLQKSFKAVLALLRENVVEIYSMSEDDRTRINEKGELYLIDVSEPPKVEEFEGLKVLSFGEDD